MNRLTTDQLRRMLLYSARVIVENEPYLTKIDTIIGDGDHGIGMKRGFTALEEMLSTTAFENPAQLFRATGIELVKTMGGASGVIFGTLFIGGLEHLTDSNGVTAAQLAAFFDAGQQAIQKRGKAKPGQKTMLDALAPAVEAMEKSAAESDDIKALLEAASLAAQAGAAHSSTLRSRTGRSKNFHEATIGHPDPGAISTSLIFKAFSDFLYGEETDESPSTNIPLHRLEI
ncbi:dihydroxyacetone kinase subunit DhaL [Oscillospiraceae bacterium MB08-C2-2]|nr:dihydroxyacetone kinase subunit DhaL [Oscillospiraceae bacterium MB08-C2-2]